jgi:ectoine hydroxylase-related dioxygenase (phytanoyl-CoA dioxygenase family)
MEPGDVVFFGGRILHRSHTNTSATRSRRSFVAHYCSARSYVPWHDEPLDGAMGNGRHILARGETHLPHALPRSRRREHGHPAPEIPPPRTGAGRA